MLTKERKGEIALLILKDRLRDEGIRLKPGLRRDIGNQAKKIGIPTEEALEFIEGFTRELVEEIFPPRSTSHFNPEYTKGM